MAHESTEFISYCERLWSSWLQKTGARSPWFEERFDLDAAPEPYLVFGAAASPLVALTTNPGATLPFQRRNVVISGGGPIDGTMNYASAAVALGIFYQQTLASRPAGRRIAALKMLARRGGRDGVMQAETCPFHSASLPNKASLLEAFSRDTCMMHYLDHLKTFLKERTVVIVSAVSSQTSLHAKSVMSPWIAWQARLAGLEVGAASFVPLIEKRGKTTCAAFVSRQHPRPKALVLMMGSNQLPGENGLALLGRELFGSP